MIANARSVERVLRALELGPATVDELAADMGWNHRNLSAVLHNLQKQQRVHSKPYHGVYKQKGDARLYALPEHRL
jgi:DNA-binding HxlR family transcriptional regulator